MDKIRGGLARLRHADVWILLAAGLLLLLFFFADNRTRHCTETKFYSPWLRCLLLLCICLIAYLGGLLRAARTGSATMIPFLLGVFFLLYLWMILSFTLLDQGLRLSADRLAEQGLTPRQYYLRWFVNFRPFESIYTVYIKGLLDGYVNLRYTLLNLLGNLCAFMPFAFFLPAFFRPMRRWYVFLPTILLIVAAVEGMQFWLMVGSCDVDDLILNAGGAFLLFWLLRIPPLRRFCECLRTGRFTFRS